MHHTNCLLICFTKQNLFGGKQTYEKISYEKIFTLLCKCRNSFSPLNIQKIKTNNQTNTTYVDSSTVLNLITHSLFGFGPWALHMLLYLWVSSSLLCFTFIFRQCFATLLKLALNCYLFNFSFQCIWELGLFLENTTLTSWVYASVFFLVNLNFYFILPSP